MTLAEDIALLGSLGEIVTIQIDLNNAERVATGLREVFNDSEDIGLYVDNMILQRVLEHHNIDYHSIMEKIAEITGDYETIDSVTALIRLAFDDTPVEVTVQLLGNHQSPQLMQISDHSNYFRLVQLIQTRWQFARGSMV